MQYRSLFISDLHLGSRNSSIDLFLEFIKYNEFQKLYLVGDIIDLIALKRKITWSTKENLVIQKILRLARKGVEVYYIPGNHDREVHMFSGDNLGNIHIQSQIITIIDYQRVLVVHGDEFDGILRNATFLYGMGEFAYDLLFKLNPIYNKFMRLFNPKSTFSLSFFLKYKVKNVLKYLSNFEHLLVEKARANKCCVVICGHSHFPEQKVINDILYLNCGCWTSDSSGSAVVEHMDGKMELLKKVQLLEEDYPSFLNKET